MDTTGLSFKEAFRGFGDLKEALHRELDLSNDEWEVLAGIEECFTTEDQLWEHKLDDRAKLQSILCDLLRKKFVVAHQVQGAVTKYCLTLEGAQRLDTIRNRFGEMLRSRFVLMDREALRAQLRTIEVFMAREHVPLDPPRRRRFH
jgi:hypothetical protein